MRINPDVGGLGQQSGLDRIPVTVWCRVWIILEWF